MVPLDPLVGIFGLYFSPGILSFLLPVVDTKTLSEGQTYKSLPKLMEDVHGRNPKLLNTQWQSSLAVIFTFPIKKKSGQEFEMSNLKIIDEEM